MAVCSSYQERDWRANFLVNLCSSASLKFGFDRVLGIATESSSAIVRSTDFFFGQGLSFEGDELKKAQAMVDSLWTGRMAGGRDTEY